MAERQVHANPSAAIQAELTDLIAAGGADRQRDHAHPIHGAHQSCPAERPITAVAQADEQVGARPTNAAPARAFLRGGADTTQCEVGRTRASTAVESQFAGEANRTRLANVREGLTGRAAVASLALESEPAGARPAGLACACVGLTDPLSPCEVAARQTARASPSFLEERRGTERPLLSQLNTSSGSGCPRNCNGLKLIP